MMKKDYTVDELIRQASSAARLGRKEKLSELVEILLMQIDLDDWTENENPDWPNQLLILMDALEELEEE